MRTLEDNMINFKTILIGWALLIAVCFFTITTTAFLPTAVFSMMLFQSLEEEFAVKA